MLMGFKQMELTNLNNSFMKIYKCLICNKFTHSVIAINQSKSNKTHNSNMSLDDRPESIGEQSMITGSFKNAPLSHSSIIDATPQTGYKITLVTNTTDLIVRFLYK